MLDERKANILKAVVKEYIATAQPVGSSHIANAPGVNVSSATVRNDMAALDHEGYLHQPHTSSGRIPTEKGYRWFVDHLNGPGALGAAEAQQIRAFFAKAHGELEQMLRDTSKLLSNLTRYAAVVVGPPHKEAIVRSVQVVGLSPRLALLVAVLSNGVVEKRTLELVSDTDDAALTAASVRLSEILVGQTLEAGARAEVTGPAAQDEVVQLGLESLKVDVDADDGEVYTSGTSGLAQAFDAVAQVGEVLRLLEQQYVVVSLMKDLLDRGLSVAIGTETGLEPLAECAVVVAPYQIDGEPVGTIGVLGPARMDYPQALAAVSTVSRRLGARLSEA
ncbi:MAG: heat-inducible transcriptional repressor HrcA [Acidimicrobiales bacterium]|nr:heat-inducible transcriptional repressor HrcA [Acidimicrobiales bacterium]